MKFKLIESIYTPLSKNELMNLKQNGRFIETKTPIYRGLGDIEEEAVLIQRNFGLRRSSSSLNYHNEIINHDPSWKAYPKREVICTTSKEMAMDYGNVYLVLPTENAKIGICPKPDIWYSFRTGIDKSWKDYHKMVNVAELNHYLNYVGIIDNYEDMEEHEFFNKIVKTFSPRLNGFQVKQITNSLVLPENREVWFDCECLLIRLDIEENEI
jgi:hypothetical protein